MRIVFDATPLDTGHSARGIGTYVSGLIQGLRGIDSPHEWLLLSHRPERQRARWPEAHWVKVPNVNARRLGALISHQIVLPWLLRQLPCDLIHFPSISAHLSVTGLPWHRPTPYVVTIHDLIPLHFPELARAGAINRAWYALQRRWAAAASAVICVSQATREDATKVGGIPGEKCRVVYEGVDLTRFHPATARNEGPPYILFIGGDYPNKNRAAVYRAFERLCQETRLPHRLVLIGPEKQTDQELAARHPGLDLSRVSRIPYVPPDELARRLRLADVFVFPSRYEGFGLPVLEAMASGTPVITSNRSSLPEVAGDAAIQVDPDEPNELFVALCRVLTDRPLWYRLREQGLARAQTFSWKRTAEETVAVYEIAVT